MKVFSISNRKGGVGKSTWTRIITTLFFHMSFGKLRICLIDFDDQATTSKQRKRELKNPGLIERLKKMFPEDYQDRIKSFYPIYSWSYDEYIKNQPTLRKNFDVVFLDFPGHMDLEQTMVLESMDKVIIPVLADEDDIDSSMSYMKVCYKFNIKAAWFLNKYRNTNFTKFIIENGQRKFFETLNPDLEQLKYADDHENKKIAGQQLVINDRPEVTRVSKSTVIPYDDLENNVRTMIKWLLK